MASTLGKRARAPDNPSSLVSRKRRTRFSIINDENADPEFVQRDQEAVRHDGDLPVENSQNVLDILNNSSNDFPVCSKHTATAGRVALSPAKVNERLKRSKYDESMSKSPSAAMKSLKVVGEPEEIKQLPTPQTPRHRDALSKRIPITPRHRVIVGGKPFTPRTPRTSSTPSNSPTVYNCARQLFVRSANPGRLIGRDNERSTLTNFIQEGVTSKSGRCMYVSGPPGTGKSALVGEVCGDLQGTEDVRTAYINCMSVKNSKDIYCKLLGDLGGDAFQQGNETVKLKTMFLPKKGTSNHVYVVTLDEIDHLLTLDLEILHTLFEWSLHRSSRLILLGIANALDLTDRFLPRLKARNLKPQLLPFLPYTVSQIASVITTKLQSLLPPPTTAGPNYVPFLHPVAIQFCSKKVASQTGDLRKAFDIVRRTIDLVEAETKQKHQDELTSEALQASPSKTPLVENINLSSPCSPSRLALKTPSLSDSLARLTPETAPRATIVHMARVTASAFNNGTAQRLQSLNLQQKAALCALVAFEKKQQSRSRNLFATPSKSANTVPTIRKL
ncbi:MAG: hypothetical protein Q9187_007608, partial [Circinaria calcarea]